LVDLIWDRKYDKSGAKSAPLQIALPFQTIETLNESSQQRQKSIESFLTGRGQTEWRNRLIWGDKKYVLPSLLPEFANSVDLIYIDPPFDTGADFSYLVEVPDHQVDTTSFTKLPSMIEQKAYRDTWGAGSTHLDSYLRWFYETIVLLVKLLKHTGLIYIHLDWHVVHYAKVIADEILGRENFRGEIIWQRFTFHSDAKRFGMVHDTLLQYSRSETYTYNHQFGKWNEDYIRSHFKKDENGRYYTLSDPTAEGQGPPRRFGEKMLEPPPGAHWRWTQDTIDEMIKEVR
jgi:adenine-specific DNA-methyltransferase